MKFSEYFGIEPPPEDSWFDPFLNLDTKLFIDPFLLYADEFGSFAGSHEHVVAFFNSVFQMISRSRGNRDSLLWRRAAHLLRFPEVEELCIGYTSRGTRGSGSGSILAEIITEALWEAVRAGLIEISHFEEVRILREGIGADRISDITAGLLRDRLTQYTEDVCRGVGIELSVTRYPRGRYDPRSEQWTPIEAALPRNPYNNRPILLVPRRYLQTLPTIDPYDFWEFCFDNANETLRDEYSQDITKRVDKATIVDLARRHPDLRAAYIAHVEEVGPQRYDFERDPRGLYQWYDHSKRFCRANPLIIDIASQDEFAAAIGNMIRQFANFVRNNRGWKLLWNDNGVPKVEEASQLLFLGTVQHYCSANDIDIIREADIGRGPVDFRTSRGHQLRALFEIKLAKNTRFWNGLARQLPAYMQAEGINKGYFIVVVLSPEDQGRLEGIAERVRMVNDQTGYHIRHVIVDASYGGPPSASRL
jgi:hypothetical protein